MRKNEESMRRVFRSRYGRNLCRRTPPILWRATLAALPAVIAIQFCFCAARTNTNPMVTRRAQPASALRDTLSYFEAHGTIAVSLHGERYRGKIAVTLKQGDSLTCELYTPFGYMPASLITDRDSARFVAGEQDYRTGVRAPVSVVPFFKEYPFIFSDLVRIITGRVYTRDLFCRNADAVWKQRGKIVHEWAADSLSMRLIVSAATKRIITVSYAATKGVPWHLEYASFKNGISRKIYFKSGEKNYFSLLFDSVLLY